MHNSSQGSRARVSISSRIYHIVSTLTSEPFEPKTQYLVLGLTLTILFRMTSMIKDQSCKVKKGEFSF